MMGMPPTEAVLIIVVAHTMLWSPVAEVEQRDQLGAESIIAVPAAETAPVNLLEQGSGASVAVSMH
jgi:hypothetical protein